MATTKSADQDGDGLHSLHIRVQKIGRLLQTG